MPQDQHIKVSISYLSGRYFSTQGRLLFSLLGSSISIGVTTLLSDMVLFYLFSVSCCLVVFVGAQWQQSKRHATWQVRGSVLGCCFQYRKYVQATSIVPPPMINDAWARDRERKGRRMRNWKSFLLTLAENKWRAQIRSYLSFLLESISFLFPELVPYWGYVELGKCIFVLTWWHVTHDCRNAPQLEAKVGVATVRTYWSTVG
jgi:hypothetical protein